MDPTRYVPTDRRVPPGGGIVIGTVVGGTLWAIVVGLIVVLL